MKGPEEEEEVGQPWCQEVGGGLLSLLQIDTFVLPFCVPDVTELIPSINLRRAACGSPRVRRKGEARSHEW